MASTKHLAFLAVVAVLLLASSSWCAVAVYPQPDGTAAVMAVTSFQKGGDGGGPASCDGKFHSDSELLVAMSTKFLEGGVRCNKPLMITSSQNAHHVIAKVVDECDSQSGCKDTLVATSKAVWAALGLDTDAGEVPVAWADVV